MPVPNTFANATATIPLSQLDANFATTITLGNTAIQLGNTVSTLNNMTLANVTVTSGNVTITNVTVTTANVTTANIATAQIANVTVSGTGTFAAGSNTAPSITTSGDTNTGIFFPAADTVAIGTGGTEALRVNSSQSLLLNTTSAPAASAKMKIATSARTGAFFDLTATGGENWIIDSTNTTGSTDVLGIYANGTTGWYLRDDGNVGIGTSSPASKLHVTGLMRICDASAYLLFRNAADNTSNGVVQFPDSGAASVQQYRNEALYFATNNNERARITSDGDFLIGATSNFVTTQKTLIERTNDRQLALNATTSGNGVYTTLSFANQSSIKTQMFWLSTDSRFYVQNNTLGVYLAQNGTSWTSASDERLKADLTPITDAVSKVATLRAVTGRFIEDEETVSRSFLIAQDVQAVFPQAVDADDPEKLGVRYTDTIPLLVAAIKELKAELDATKAEVAALKGAA